MGSEREGCGWTTEKRAGAGGFLLKVSDGKEGRPAGDVRDRQATYQIDKHHGKI